MSYVPNTQTQLVQIFFFADLDELGHELNSLKKSGKWSDPPPLMGNFPFFLRFFFTPSLSSSLCKPNPYICWAHELYSWFCCGTNKQFMCPYFLLQENLFKWKRNYSCINRFIWHFCINYTWETYIMSECDHFLG